MKSYLAANWFDVFQSIAIVTTLVIAIASFRSETKSRHISNQIDLMNSHRDIWKQIIEKTNLDRIRLSSVDLEEEPITQQERQFVKLIIQHVNTSFQANTASQVNPIEGLEEDLIQFFSNPIPKIVWKEVRRLQNSEFRELVDKQIEKGTGDR